MHITEMIRKYFIMGSQNCTRAPEEILQEALEAGITAFQYREKGRDALTGRAKIELGKKLRKLCQDYNVPFIINDDVELATILEVDGIHVGQDDTPIERLREQFPNLILGLSVSNETELEKSPIELVDYVGAGPMFITQSKEDAKTPVGTKWVARLRELHPKLPIVAIGGITTENAPEVLAAGADGVAVISAITQAEHIYDAVKKL